MWPFRVYVGDRGAAQRHHLRPRHDHHSTDDVRDGHLPRYAQQRAGVHEAPRSPEGAVRESDGLRRINVGNDQGDRHQQGSQLLPKGHAG